MLIIIEFPLDCRYMRLESDSMESMDGINNTVFKYQIIPIYIFPISIAELFESGGSR